MYILKKDSEVIFQFEDFDIVMNHLIHIANQNGSKAVWRASCIPDKELARLRVSESSIDNTYYRIFEES